MSGLGWGHSRRPLGSMQRLMRNLTLSLDGTLATPALSEGKQDATIDDNGVGDYTVNFNEPFKRLPAVVASPLTADTIVIIGTKALGSVQILAFDATDGTTAKEAEIDIIVQGADTADQY